MGIRIYQLPAIVANQIAAGEVIERPASVVKELLENSFDAGADQISVEIGYGGLNQIKISDNGIGIFAEDLPLAIAAHATSKITKLDDLYAIDSMGFRGEALASIASVAKLTISSRPQQQEHAMMLQIKGAEYTLSPCARNVGTTIDASDLFFNAPVRKRFLKSEKLEFQAIETVFKRFALSAPHTALTLKHNNKLVLSLPPAINEQAKQTRMTKIFGNSFMKEAIFLDAERGGMRLSGWISSPTFQRSQNDRQWIYINQRMVKDKLINHALKQAYEDLLHPGRFPACLLYFNIKSSDVDVNVHPTKHEVRFQEPRLVHDFFTSHLREALQTHAVKDNKQDYALSANASSQQSLDLCEPLPPLFHAPKSTNNRATDSSDSIQQEKNSWVFLNNQYILSFIKKQAYIVDVIKLQQHELLSQLMALDLPLESRPLLVPISYSIRFAAAPKEVQQFLDQLGIRIEFQNENNVLVRSVPIKVPYLDIKLFLNSIADRGRVQLSHWVELICQSQVFDPRLLSIEERMHLDQFLFKVQNETLSEHSFYKALSLENCRMLLDV